MDFTSLLVRFADYLNAPAIALIIMFVGAFYFLRQAQSRPDFDLGNMFKNEAGKESVAALGAMVCLILTGWVLVYDTFSNKEVNIQLYTIYLVGWSGTKVAEKLVDALSAKWSK